MVKVVVVKNARPALDWPWNSCHHYSQNHSPNPLSSRSPARLVQSMPSVLAACHPALRVLSGEVSSTPSVYGFPRRFSLAAEELPNYPPKGGRRRLDEQWLHRLHHHGLSEKPGDASQTPAELVLAVVQFNQGSFWECHETLEQVWLPEKYPLRLFYQGLIKAAVGLLHLGRRNQRGAAKKLHEAAYTLAPFQPHFMGIDIDRLRRDTLELLTYLPVDGSVDWEDVGRLPPVRIVPPSAHGA